MAILILFERTFGRSRNFFLNRCRCIHLHFNTSLLQPRFHSQTDWPLKHHLGGNRWFNCPRFLKCPPETTTSTFSIPQISLWQEQKGKFHPFCSIATTPRVKKAIIVQKQLNCAFFRQYRFNLRQRLNERGFTSTQFHDFKTASKSMRVYTETFSPENQSRNGKSDPCSTRWIHHLESNSANYEGVTSLMAIQS